MSAIAALIADLCGEDDPTPPRLSVAQALRLATPGSVGPAIDRGRPVALVVLSDRRAFVVDDRCPHDGGSLSDGFLEDDRLVCARHGWEIDPCEGTCGLRRIQTRAVGSLR